MTNLAMHLNQMMKLKFSWIEYSSNPDSQKLIFGESSSFLMRVRIQLSEKKITNRNLPTHVTKKVMLFNIELCRFQSLSICYDVLIYEIYEETSNQSCFHRIINKNEFCHDVINCDLRPTLINLLPNKRSQPVLAFELEHLVQFSWFSLKKGPLMIRNF